MTPLLVGERAERMLETTAGLLRTRPGRRVGTAPAAVREAVAARFLRRTVAVTDDAGRTYRGRVVLLPVSFGRHTTRLLVLERPEYVALAFPLTKVHAIVEEAR